MTNSSVCFASEPITKPNYPCIPEGVETYSIYEDWKLEADKHKWIESEKCGYDQGERAIREWVRDHWNGYLRDRWIEHLHGIRFWLELDRGDFGLLKREFQEHAYLLDCIIERVKDCKENLDFIVWAYESQHPIELVMQILRALDINSHRLAHKFDTD